MPDRKPFRVIINDDFDSHLEFNEEIWELWGRTAVTTYSLCVGGDIANYPSKVRTTYAQNLEKAFAEGLIKDGPLRYWYEFLVVEKKDALAMAVDGCRKNGLEMWASVRMNDIHHGDDPENPYFRTIISDFWREHPEYRARGWERPRNPEVGPYPDYPKERWDYRAWASYSFEHEPVRQRVLDTVREVAENYDIDAIDLDCSRMPPFFDRHREKECAPHMTDLVRKAKAILSEVGARQGKGIKLAATVRATVAKSLAAGLDVGAWIAESLVDIVLPSQDAGTGTDVVWDSFGSPGVAICPNFDNVIRPGVGANIYVDAPVIRAAALGCHKAGADGIQLYNCFCVNEPGHFETQLFRERIENELDDPAKMEGKDAYYVYEQFVPIALNSRPPYSHDDGGIRGFYWISLPLDRRVPVPVERTNVMRNVILHINIANDIESDRANGRLREQVLTFNIVHVGPGDDIRFKFNEEPISPEAVDTHHRGLNPLPHYDYLPPYTHYEIDLSKITDIHNNWNKLTIETVSLADAGEATPRFKGLDAQLYEVELRLCYWGCK